MRLKTLAVMIVALVLLPTASFAKHLYDSSRNGEILLVQSAGGAGYTNGKLVLSGTRGAVYFSDRPYRYYGHMDNKKLSWLWEHRGKSSLGSQANATLAIPGDQNAVYVLELLGPPRFNGDVCEYDVKPLSSAPPAKLGPCNLFIDAFPCPVNCE